MTQLESVAGELGKAVYEAAADGAKGEADASGGDTPSGDSSNDDVIDAEYEVKDD